jgi:hypothetical protein
LVKSIVLAKADIFCEFLVYKSKGSLTMINANREKAIRMIPKVRNSHLGSVFSN